MRLLLFHNGVVLCSLVTVFSALMIPHTPPDRGNVIPLSSSEQLVFERCQVANPEPSPNQAPTSKKPAPTSRPITTPIPKVLGSFASAVGTRILQPFPPSTIAVGASFLSCSNFNDYNTITGGEEEEEGALSAHRLLIKRVSKASKYQVKFGTTEFEIRSRPFYSAGDLLKGSRKDEWNQYKMSFASKDVGNYDVSYITAVGDPPWGICTAEHVVERQSIRAFIQHAVEEGAVDADWFSPNWNQPIADSKIWEARTQPAFDEAEEKFTAISVNDRNLNFLVFQALGSTKITKPFAILQSTINEVKGDLWDLSYPVDTDGFRQYVKNITSGSLDLPGFLAPLRTTFAVFEYMNSRDVVDKMRATVANVGIELDNAEKLGLAKAPLQVIDHLDVIHEHRALASRQIWANMVASSHRRVDSAHGRKKKHMCRFYHLDQQTQPLFDAYTVTREAFIAQEKRANRAIKENKGEAQISTEQAALDLRREEMATASNKYNPHLEKRNEHSLEKAKEDFKRLDDGLRILKKWEKDVTTLAFLKITKG
ncbi:hypothetical protein P154DRAFT_540855 [Amniculicola lignicola CBS 123094]|uniref:Uncharacterized protein n=1 Tax=Amniculicola lignicola CBS 123094 TaxID=1392246 RepID=A0A6A5VW19_9PLEO|nr:hypothetical protein P154DRAFT_540855 [Amniculicola lignicola CBS 123094]